ncbi:MAG: methionyl aminopeptidase [Syntrophomonadaceae bacterium]|nr:methionyl aminopeptidase [Syntrophomonadaceae bacterium]MDD4549892.1 methionyl aminopeptidase [Syntrophomonadaceae bacterium]
MNRISRNDPCWCGSGIKYKKCHLEQDARLYELEQAGYPVPGRHLIRTEAEIDGIRKAGHLSSEILDMVGEKIGLGITTAEINKWVHEYTVSHGAIPASLDYYGYPASVCTSINEVVCHGIPEDRKLKDGDIINVDVTSILNGFYGDTSRMYIIGEASEEARKLVQVTKECLNIGIEQVKPFNRVGDIAYAIEQHAEKYGFSVVQDFGGHGIGLKFHEDPFIAHYGNKDEGMVLVPNMVFTIEPMLNAGRYQCKVLADEWTAVTVDGSLSAQWEHTVRVTEDGAEILTK